MAETRGSEPDAMKGFVPNRPTNFQQHQRRIEQLIAEGMHDGKRWKDEAFARYNELEAEDVLETILDPAFLDAPCIICERPVRQHSPSELRQCLAAPIPKDVP